MAGKTYKAVTQQAPTQAVDIEAAVAFLKEHATAKFDETIELHIRLGVEHSQSDQMVRGSVVLPGGAPKQMRVAVFAQDAKKQEAAKGAGAKLVGGQDLIDEVQKNGTLDADVAIATPDMMPKIAKVARILGPKGLMPNPKTGTVTPDPEKAVEELAKGKVSFKMDALGNIHAAVGKRSWDTSKVVENIQAFLAAVRGVRPQTQRGEFIRTAVVKTTMGPSIRIATR